MGITGLIPFLDKASRRTNISEFSGCTVAIDSYCWLHKGAFACADKIIRGEETDIHIKYCLKYVTMLLSRNVKPILVFDGRHLPAKAMTETKRRESREISKKRAAELLRLGKTDEARSYMRRGVDITHAMALNLIKECRKRNVDCIVAPYEADAQLAYLNIRNIAQLVITEDSDLILFGCTKVLFKMDLDGAGTLVEAIKLPLVMKCPIEHYKFDRFRQMCIMSGCDYLPSLPGIGLVKARQFVTATQDPNFANALRKVPSFFNKSSLVVTDEYRENFLKAEATFKHQFVYDPIERKMIRLNEPEDEDIEQALCVNAGEIIEPKVAFQLALGNLNPFTLKKMDDWSPDVGTNLNEHVKTSSWKDIGISTHPSVWSESFVQYLDETYPWRKKVQKPEPIIGMPHIKQKKKVVNLVSKYVPETQDESLTVKALSNMYCVEPSTKKLKFDCDDVINSCDPEPVCDVQDVTKASHLPKDKSPIIENKHRSFKKCMRNNTYSVLKRLSKFPRTVMDENNVVESKFFNADTAVISNGKVEEKDKTEQSNDIIISPERVSRNPFKVCTIKEQGDVNKAVEEDSIKDTDTDLNNSQKENSPNNSPVKCEKSPIWELSPQRRPLRLKIEELSPEYNNVEDSSFIENTYPLEDLVTPVDSQNSFGESSLSELNTKNDIVLRGISRSQNNVVHSKNFKGHKKSTCKVPGLKRTASLPSNQPTLLSRFGFQKKPALKM